MGCSTPAEVEALADVGRSGVPLSQEEHDRLIKLFAHQAATLAYYRGVIRPASGYSKANSLGPPPDLSSAD